MSRSAPRHRSLLDVAIGALQLLIVMTISCAGVAAAKHSQVLPSPQAEAMELAPCKLPDVAQAVRCGALRVPENPQHPAGRQLAIGVAVVASSDGQKHPDPIVVLMGGPGEDAISAAALYVQQFGTLLHDHDLLLVDERGTGRSGALPCNFAWTDGPAAHLRDLFPPAAVKQCARQLRERADLTQYDYPRFADDLERVRRALGYGPMNLLGGSYGTRAEQVYLRAYPQSVRSAYFGSVVPVDAATPLAMARTADAVLQQLFNACADDGACHAAFPNLPEEFRQVAARLEAGPVNVPVPGHPGSWPLYRGRVAEWVRTQLYRPGSAAVLPWAIHRAYLGDWSPIVDDMASGAGGSDFSFGLFFAITCNEDIPFMSQQDIASQTQGSFLGDHRIREQQAACKYWPRTALPPGYRKAVHSSVPALFVTGDADGGTPLWYTRHVVEGFPNAAVVVVHDQGHTEWNDCVAGMYRRLIESGSANELQGSRCAPVPRPPFKTR